MKTSLGGSYQDSVTYRAGQGRSMVATEEEEGEEEEEEEEGAVTLSGTAALDTRTTMRCSCSCRRLDSCTKSE